jgi:NTE family protein
VGLSLEAGRIRKPLVETNSDDVLHAGSLFLAADSPLGPMYLAYGRADGGNSSIYFFLGRPFQ